MLRNKPSSPELDLDALSPAAPRNAAVSGISKFFDPRNSLERERILAKHVDELLQASLVKQESTGAEYDVHKKYFAFLEAARKSPYFLSLQDKFMREELLSPGEYMYFALTTDDVNDLLPEALREMTRHYEHDNFAKNINVLIAALEWQDAKLNNNKEEIEARIDHLKETLQRRGSSRGNCEMFLNLHNIDLAGADLSCESLDFTDLGDADFSKANLYDTHFVFSNLDRAVLRNPNCVRPDLKGHMEKGPTIKHCSAKNAIFDGMVATNVDWSQSDFTGSYFRDAHIGPGCYTNSIFDETDFHSGSLIFASNYMTTRCSLRNANFITGKILGADYERLDMSGTKLIDDRFYTSAQHLQKALDTFNLGLLDPVRNSGGSEKYVDAEITARKEMLANNVIDRLSHASRMTNADKAKLFDLALDHNVFQPEKLVYRMANSADHSIFSLGNTLFGDPQPHHACYTTSAMKLLEAARDELLNVRNTPRM